MLILVKNHNICTFHSQKGKLSEQMFPILRATIFRPLNTSIGTCSSLLLTQLVVISLSRGQLTMLARARLCVIHELVGLMAVGRWVRSIAHQFASTVDVICTSFLDCRN
jgi:hypothetical protein